MAYKIDIFLVRFYSKGREQFKQELRAESVCGHLIIFGEGQGSWMHHTARAKSSAVLRFHWRKMKH